MDRARTPRLDRDARVVYVRRAFTNGRLECTKTAAEHRAVPLQAIALEALDRFRPTQTRLLFPSPRGGYLDLHNFRRRALEARAARSRDRPAAAIYDLRHTFATFALEPASPPSTSPASWARA